MDQLPALGKSIGQIIRPTGQIYATLLKQNAAEIRTAPRTEFSYGPDPRQKLDVYHPTASPTGKGCPVLVFLYGGGLVNGAKQHPMIGDGLVYANLGHFFADKYGFITVVVDYRLVPQAKFPSGGEDLALAVEWIRTNLKEFGQDNESKDLFIMGNSAGGIHLSTYLFSPAFADVRKHVLTSDVGSKLRLRGAVLLSVPFHFHASDPTRTDVLGKYYGNRIDEDCPFGLMKALKEKSSISDALPGVKFLALTGTLDPEDEILLPNRDFVEAWNADQTPTQSSLDVQVMDGHNHISPPLALSTGDPKEEAWGVLVAEFCTSR